ncbi:MULTISPECIES: DUF2188 domain-containing protein [unclassified Nocardioides]|uniref:DUF2188 domain-containing protein n=1 Tax=unclassified Nocardioides TaxID=2615069 RepID=UPI0002E9FA7A|nr:MULTISPECIES: DUF2188 domain-containing protein [unclassified Nocardioides]MBI2244354.1 DUF2188 domain-containing protein [Nocardioides sp.]
MSVETYFEHDAWHNWDSVEGELPGTHETQEGAVAAGGDEARRRGVEHVIRNAAAVVEEIRRYDARG